MSLFRPSIDNIPGYTPGEQPQESGWIKLNTNENPYPPSPRVADAIVETARRNSLNLYPDPLATDVRRKVASLFGVDADWVLPGNGSDENLTLLMRGFVDPNESIGSPYPSYILYETLAALQGAGFQRLMLKPDWSWEAADAEFVASKTKLFLVPNPNSPIGNRWSFDQLAALQPKTGVLVIDEAYGDFATVPTAASMLHGPNGKRIVITRTLSKSYSLAGIRLGFAIAHPDLITGMRKAKDSYNCDAISLAAAAAALDDQQWMKDNVAKIVATRRTTAAALTQLGMNVLPSEANFLWATHPQFPARQLYETLKSRRILVRYMKYEGVPWSTNGRLEGLRITIGTDDQMTRLLAELREILES